MTTKTKKKETKNQNKSGAEKPVSLWGASFTEVIQALLKTKPDKSKQTGKASKTKPSKNER